MCEIDHASFVYADLFEAVLDGLRDLGYDAFVSLAAGSEEALAEWLDRLVRDVSERSGPVVEDDWTLVAVERSADDARLRPQDG